MIGVGDEDLQPREMFRSPPEDAFSNRGGHQIVRAQAIHDRLIFCKKNMAGAGKRRE